jgi:hypothetical protein
MPRDEIDVQPLDIASVISHLTPEQKEEIRLVRRGQRILMPGIRIHRLVNLGIVDAQYELTDLGLEVQDYLREEHERKKLHDNPMRFWHPGLSR